MVTQAISYKARPSPIMYNNIACWNSRLLTGKSWRSFMGTRFGYGSCITNGCVLGVALQLPYPGYGGCIKKGIRVGYGSCITNKEKGSQSIGAGVFHFQFNNVTTVNSEATSINKTRNRAKLAGIAAALINEHTHIATGSAGALWQISK